MLIYSHILKVDMKKQVAENVCRLTMFFTVASECQREANEICLNLQVLTSEHRTGIGKQVPGFHTKDVVCFVGFVSDSAKVTTNLCSKLC